MKLTRVQYAYAPVLAGTAGELTEARMDASLSGDYRPLVLFINSLERDKMFFVINGRDADRTAERDGGSAAAADDVSARSAEDETAAANAGGRRDGIGGAVRRWEARNEACGAAVRRQMALAAIAGSARTDCAWCTSASR